MSYDQEYYNKTEVVCDGKVTIQVQLFDDPEGADMEPCSLVVKVLKDTTVLQEFSVMADDIELVRL